MYSIVIQSLFMNAFALVFWQVSRINYCSDNDKFSIVFLCACFFIAYLEFAVVELLSIIYNHGLDQHSIAELHMAQFGFIFMSMLFIYYSDFAIMFVNILFGCWLFFVWRLSDLCETTSSN